MNELFEQFTKERQYLKNVTPKTLIWYRTAWNACRPFLPVELSGLTQQSLKACAMTLCQRGLSAITVNTYLRVVNAFANWLLLEGHIQTRLRVPRMTEEKKVPRTFTVEEIQRFVKYQPQTLTEQRAYTVGCLLIDTGLRIKELLGLTRSDIDMNTALLTIHGKGRKYRVVPFSIPARRILFRWLENHSFEIAFPTRTGKQTSYRNLLRDLQKIAKSLNISGSRTSFHTFRHTFGLNYIRRGGNVFMLQRILGHSTLEMTRKYVSLQTADLSAAHERLSMLAG